MIPRGVLDISWRSLLGAACGSFTRAAIASEAAAAVERGWNPERPVLATLSVRSGLDLLLRALAWPAGSEVLMSAVTIPHMAEIVRAHGLVPVPVDVNVDTLAPDVEQLQARITSRTRAILVAHLFGSRINLEEIAHIAAANGLPLWEDVAQGFAGDGHRGDESADVSCFSFGLIKAQTALGGAIMRLRDADLAERCRAVHEQWPEQPARAFRRKVYRALLLRGLSQHAMFTAVDWLAARGGIDLDARISQASRGFGIKGWLEQLRYRPCAIQLELLRRQLAKNDCPWMARKTALAEQYRSLLPSHVLCWRDASFPTHWVLPIRSRDPVGLCQRLRRQGFDATQRGSQMAVISPPPEHPDWHTPQVSACLPQLVFLPLHPALTQTHIACIGAIVASEENER